MTRPRSIGTAQLAGRAPPGDEAREGSTSVLWMSTKKKFGARSGRLPEICRRRLPSISASVTSSVSAEPERQHHRRRQRAGPVDVADRQPQRVERDARAPAREPLHERWPTLRSTMKAEDRGADEDRARCAGRRRTRMAQAASATSASAASAHDIGAGAAGARPRSPSRETAPSPARRARGRAAAARRPA